MFPPVLRTNPFFINKAFLKKMPKKWGQLFSSYIRHFKKKPSKSGGMKKATPIWDGSS